MTHATVWDLVDITAEPADRFPQRFDLAAPGVPQLDVGDLVKLVFEKRPEPSFKHKRTDDTTAEGEVATPRPPRPREKLWVKVLRPETAPARQVANAPAPKIAEDDDSFVGELYSTSALMTGLRPGRRITFETRHILAVERVPKPTLRESLRKAADAKAAAEARNAALTAAAKTLTSTTTTEEVR